MQINFYPNVSVVNNRTKIIQRTKPLPFDTVSFTAIKKTKLNGLDLACANIFKAPLEKFNSKEDLDNWAENKLQTMIKTANYPHKNPRQKKELDKRLEEWIDFFNKEEGVYANKPAVDLIAYNAITKNIDLSKNVIPPYFDKVTFGLTVRELETQMKEDRNSLFDFEKKYREILLKKTIMESPDDLITQTDEGFWIEIPSQKQDPKNFEANLRNLKNLSHKTWCTSNYLARDYLESRSFSILFENNQPKAAIKSKDGVVEEIQNEKNNNFISNAYLSKIEDYASKKTFIGMNKKIAETIALKEYVQSIKDDFSKEIEQDDYVKLLTKLGIEVNVLKNGNYQLSHYKQPSIKIKFKDIGVDENKLFEKIELIKDFADFNKSDLTSTGALKKIDGAVFFSNSKIKNLGILEEINGDANFNFSKITSLGNLKHISGNAYFDNDNVDFRDAQIDGNVYVQGKKIQNINIF